MDDAAGRPDPKATDASAPSSVSRLPLIAMGALVALALLITLAFGLRGPEEFPVGSAEATVQIYLQANLDGDDQAVLATLTAERSEICAESVGLYSTYGIDGIAFELDQMDVEGDIARAELTQRRASSGDPFDSPTRLRDEFVELRREDNEWKVHAASWPWRFADCLRAQ